MNPLRSPLCLLFCLGLAAQAPAPGFSRAESEPAQDVSLQRPVHTSGPLLSHVHFDRPMADGPLWAIGNRWKARFDPTGVQVIPFFGSHAPRNFPLDVTLTSAAVGNTRLELVAGTPTQVGNEVRTHRGGLTEVVATSLDSLEQSWVFEHLPMRDAITVDVHMSGDYRVSPIEGGLRFANEHGHVDYRKAVAVDGQGRRLSLPIEWLGDRARMQIPASFVATAELPIVLDPTYNYWFDLGSTAPVGQLQSEPDVSTLQILNGRTLMIWRRQQSLTDQDAWAILFDGNLGIVRPDFALDFTSDDWLKVACAGNIQAQNFLVVSEVRIGIQHNIFGRLVDAAGMPQPVLQIERDGVVGTPGNNFHPDVGNETFAGQSRYTIVWNKKYLLASDIVMKQVMGTGGLVTTNPIPVASSPADEHLPSISKCAGHLPGDTRWLVTWQQPWNAIPITMDVRGCFISWSGTVGLPFIISWTNEEETNPSAGSPIDANGQRLWPVVYESRPNTNVPRRLVCKMLRSDATSAYTFEASTTSYGDKTQAEVDSDGTRVNIAYTIFDGTNLDVEVATFAMLPSTVREDARQRIHHVFSHQHKEPNIAADVSGGNGTTTRHCLPIRNETTNTLELFAWAGFAGSANFFSSTAWGCGQNVPIAAWGAPVIGESVFAQVAGGSPLAGTMFGFPNPLPIGPCGCYLAAGANPIISLGSFAWTVPNNPIYVGIDLTVQGFLLGGNQCVLGLADLGDAINFRIR